MELYFELLLHAMENNTVQISFPDFTGDIPAIIHDKCYETLQKIKAVVQDDSLSDPDCFDRIEAIVRALEDAGINPGARHDFG